MKKENEDKLLTGLLAHAKADGFSIESVLAKFHSDKHHDIEKYRDKIKKLEKKIKRDEDAQDTVQRFLLDRKKKS